MRPFHDVLSSGLKVVTIETPHLHSAFCSVYVRVGSRHENERSNGVSHLLEHLFFRGSQKFRDSVRMNAAVEAVGGNLNGSTSRDSSAYYTPAHPDGIGVAIRILGDMLTRPLLTHVETEKRVVLEEMLDEVDERGRDVDVENLTKQQLFGSHPLGLKIAGTTDSVKALTLKQVRTHFESKYVTGNLVVAVAGPVKRDAVVREVEKAFVHLPKGHHALEVPAPAVKSEGPRIHFVTLDEAQVEFRLCFPTVAEDHRDAQPLGLLRRVLDDGLSSRLPFNVVEKRGLAYSIGASIDAYRDFGSFDIDGACAPQNLGAVIDEIGKTLATLQAGKITPEELERAKRRLRMHLGFLQDSPADLCGWFGGIELFRPAETFAQREKIVAAVTRADLIRVAKTYLRPEKLLAVAVGSKPAKKPFEKAVGVLGRRLSRGP